MEKVIMKGVLLIVIFFSTSFYSDNSKNDIGRLPFIHLRDFQRKLNDMRIEAKNNELDFYSTNNKIDSLCKSYDKF